MDLSCIISSGDLELYVLGMLPEEEAKKIGQLSSLFPEVKAEIDHISETLLGIDANTFPAPSASVKESLMNKLHSLKASEQNEDGLTVSYVNKDADTLEEETEVWSATPVIPITKEKNIFSYLQAASVIIAVLCIGAIIYLVSVTNQYRSEIFAMHQKMDTLHHNISVQQQKNVAFNKTLEMMHNNDYKKILLTHVPGKPDVSAQVFWNTKTHEVYVADVSLPNTPSNKQYQLWAIVDGKPVDAGLLQNDKQVAQKMKTFLNADAFAITLENKGGSPSPTMEAMYVMAKV